MGMPAPLQEWTAEQARALPADGNRYEVLDGELFVTPAPRLRHQWALMDLLLLLQPYVQQLGLERVLFAPADIEYSPHRLVQPDLFVVPFVPGAPPTEWRDVRDLQLVVEVLSPGTAYADRHRKRRIYQAEGIPQYWIVDLDARLVECWRPGDERPAICEERLSWQPRPDHAPLVIDLAAFFAAQP